MRILVTGSRAWTDEETISKVVWGLTDVYQTRDILVVHGDCPTGADAIVKRLATQYNWTQEAYPAEWQRYGRRAGYVRNAEMVKLGADICLAFIQDNSRGASMTASLAEKAGIPTHRFHH